MKHLILIFIALLAMASCTSTRYVPITNTQRDSIYITKERTDTITQVVEVERPLRLSQKVMMNVGGFALVILIILIGFGILKLIRKL